MITARPTAGELGLTDEHILLVQSGKQSRLKKLPEMLRAFAAALTLAYAS